ncbi:MAG: cyclic nucleotide-binding domain-containing protein [Planctomycetes bacterium]|nr:cyclic nucleotide-binding domain-containing protein [Planctomycetota bacterium]
MITRELLREVEIFKGLSDEQIEKLLPLARAETFRKGDAIFRERDPASKIYIVLSGVVEVGRTMRPEGRFLRLARLERGQMLGELALFDDAPRSSGAVAALVPETRVGSWEIQALHALFEQDPALANRVLRSLVKRLAHRLRATAEGLMALLKAFDGSRE